MISFLGQPLILSSSWSDTDSDGYNDLWSGTYTVADLDQNYGQDVDGDNATNAEEAAYNSDPFVFDTDGDGLSDGDEIHLAIQQNGKSYSLTSWDSDGDFVSDHDDFQNFYSVTYTAGLPSFPNASYSDYDGDGQKNHVDPYPTDPLNNDTDGDGIDESIDPVPGDESNPSPYNGQPWYSDALGDADGDSSLNFWDTWPYDSSNGLYSDFDGDGIYDSADPVPNDPSNPSEINGVSWAGAALDDWDGDSVANFYDSTPYPNADGDAYPDNVDPAPNDSSNLSSVNGIEWYDNALGDDDGDEVTNFDDVTPYPPPADSDMDGYPDSEDPLPNDPTNPSPYNSTSWYSEAKWDYDGDTIQNFYDPLPSDSSNTSPVNGNAWSSTLWGDEDGDSVANFYDPAPYDASNLSPTNNIEWGSELFGDADEDGTQNFYDTTPHPDTDGDGYSDLIDPVPNDAENNSPHNSIAWYGNALDDGDSDTVLNYYDPLPSDSTNPSPINGGYWWGNVWGDDDADNFANFYDPAPNDVANYSSTNYHSWYSDALGDTDADGTLNFFDPTPWVPPPMDADQDGLNVNQEAAWGTSDTDVDSDDDGLTDYEEVEVYSTIPTNRFYLSQQRDWGDLYTDYQLVDLTDTDGDTIPDRVEEHYSGQGMSPSVAADSWRDMDGDGISNRVQYSMGIALNAHMTSYDEDLDGMTDVFEDYYQLNKQLFSDAVADADGDGVTNFEEMQLVLNPNDADTRDTGSPLGDLLLLMTHVRYPDENSPPSTDDANSNGIPDWADDALTQASAPDHHFFTRVHPTDFDGDGMSDVWEHQYGRWKFSAGVQMRVIDDQEDNDEDDLPNIFEYVLGTSPVAGDGDIGGLVESGDDPDEDGLTNAEELALGTNPLKADSDGDGTDDGEDIAPLDSSVQNLIITITKPTPVNPS